MRETVSGYFDALAERDVRSACSLVSPAFREELANYSKRAYPDLDSRECEVIANRIVQTNGDRLVRLQGEVPVRSIEVDGERATAQLGPGQVASLRRIDGDWLIERLDFHGATG